MVIVAVFSCLDAAQKILVKLQRYVYTLALVVARDMVYLFRGRSLFRGGRVGWHW